MRTKEIITRTAVAGILMSGTIAMDTKAAAAWESSGEGSTECVPDEAYGKALGHIVFKNEEDEGSGRSIDVQVVLEGEQEPVVVFDDVAPGDSDEHYLDLGATPYEGQTGEMIQTWSNQERFGHKEDVLHFILPPVEPCAEPEEPPVEPPTEPPTTPPVQPPAPPAAAPVAFTPKFTG